MLSSDWESKAILTTGSHCFVGYLDSILTRGINFQIYINLRNKHAKNLDVNFHAAYWWHTIMENGERD